MAKKFLYPGGRNPGGRPALVEGEETVRRTISLPESIDEWIIERSAKETNEQTGKPKSYSEFIRDCLISLKYSSRKHRSKS